MHAIERNINNQNWITLVLIFAIALIAILKLYNPKRLYAYFLSFFLKTFFKKKVEENSSIFNLFNTILLVYSALIIGLAIGFLSFNRRLNFIVFLLIFIALLIYMVSKIIIDFLLEKLIHKNTLTQYFRHTKLGYHLTASMWLLPILIIYQFQWQNQLFLLISFSTLMSSMIIVTTVRNKKMILGSLFYFILYLCTLEIAPLLIIYKLAQ